jgi:hypothetical protein
MGPYFLTARTDPTVDRFVDVTDHGTEVELFSSAVVPKFALRFAAAGLPPGKDSHRLIIEVQVRRPLNLDPPRK